MVAPLRLILASNAVLATTTLATAAAHGTPIPTAKSCLERYLES